MQPVVSAPVAASLAQHGFGTATAVERLTGGNVHETCRIATTSGRAVILKRNTDAPPGIFECEADGLAALRASGIGTPDIYALGADFLLLEDLGTQDGRSPDWERFGRAVALLHLHRADQFGYPRDNYLGPLPQINTPLHDGHAFFGRNRVLRYLSEPSCAAVLTSDDRRQLERLVTRLPDLIPDQPPSLLHGDLWHTNMLTATDGTPAVIDPAVYYGWPEAELSQTRLYGVVPPAFYDAYNEVNPLAPGWPERLDLLAVRQHMAVLAFFGDRYGTLAQLRALLARFA